MGAEERYIVGTGGGSKDSVAQRGVAKEDHTAPRRVVQLLNRLARGGRDEVSSQDTPDFTGSPRITPEAELIIGETYFPLVNGTEQRGEGDLHPRDSLPERQEVTLSWSHRDIEPADVDQMINDGWYKDFNRVRHLIGDTINTETLPQDWNDPEQVDKFRKIMHSFYFPGGPFEVKAYDDKGNHIRDAIVRRHTLVAEKEGKLAGVTSWLEGEDILDEKGNIIGKSTGDPWSKEDEPLSSHTQMHLVRREFSGQGIGLYLAILRTDRIFKAGYQQIVTWVNTIGDTRPNDQLFYEMGYDDRGKTYLNPTVPDQALFMRRYTLDSETWQNGELRPNTEEGGVIQVGRSASIERMLQKQKGYNLRPQNLG